MVGAAGGTFEEELAVLRGETKYGRLVGVKGTIGEVAAAAGPQVGEFGENVVDGDSETPSAGNSLAFVAFMASGEFIEFVEFIEFYWVLKAEKERTTPSAEAAATPCILTIKR
jgi:hypothetical protein